MFITRNSFSAPIMAPVIVIAGNGSSVAYTASKLKDLLPNAILVNYGDFWCNYLAQRVYGDLIFVGHGTLDGFYFDEVLISWKQIANEIGRLPANRIYFAACYSDQLEKYLRNRKKIIYVFKGLVDVDEAAYIIASVIYWLKGQVANSKKILENLIEVMIGKIIDPWKYNLQFLYEIKKWRDIW